MQTWSKPDLNVIQTLSNPNLDTEPNLILTTWSQNDIKKNISNRDPTLILTISDIDPNLIQTQYNTLQA